MLICRDRCFSQITHDLLTLVDPEMRNVVIITAHDAESVTVVDISRIDDNIMHSRAYEHFRIMSN